MEDDCREALRLAREEIFRQDFQSKRAFTCRCGLSRSRSRDPYHGPDANFRRIYGDRNSLMAGT